MSFPTNNLLAAIQDCTARSLKSGALQPIETTAITVREGSVDFGVRMVSSLARKEKAGSRDNATSSSAPKPNPFLPYNPELFVCDISDTHVALLNKFKVIDNHLLIVTRDFESQTNLLNLDDFLALWSCLVEFDSLGFYNGGTKAGASQPHKHLQLVPLALGTEGGQLPVAPLLLKTSKDAHQIAEFDFTHHFSQLIDSNVSSTDARNAYEDYKRGMTELGLMSATSATPTNDYNLLITRNWMLIVPRAEECFRSISINSLGFAGSFFVKNEADLNRIKSDGLMTVLRAVTFPGPRTK